MSAGLFYGAGSLTEGFPGGSFGKVMAHAAAGCVGASATGGDCGNGALSAGFAEFAGPKFGNDWNAAGQTFKYAVLGGTASVLGGGKFQNGAMTGAFGYLFNCSAHPGACTAEENRADMKARREKETASVLGWMSDAKGFLDGLRGADGAAGLSKSLKVISDGADYVTVVALAVPVLGEAVAILSSLVSAGAGGASALLSNQVLRNLAPIGAGEYATRLSAGLGAGGKLAIGLGLVAQKRVDSVVNP
jgi:hypothetical protein